jgi:hypothetical protein
MNSNFNSSYIFLSTDFEYFEKKITIKSSAQKLITISRNFKFQKKKKESAEI